MTDLEKIADTISKTNNKQQLVKFLSGILTEKEITEIANRLEIVRQLKLGRPQHKIASNLGVGVATVTRGSKEIQRGKFKDIEIDK